MSKFTELINSDQPVLVDFFTEWCGPCKMMQPILKELISKVTGKARIIKIDIDNNISVADKFGIKSVPTLVIFKKGEIKWRQSGVVPADKLQEVLSKFY